MSPGPKKVEQGPCLYWSEITINPTTSPETAAYVLRECFNEAWLRDLIFELHLDICDICLDPRCLGHGTSAEKDEVHYADGECICSTCGMEFRSHPMAEDIQGFDGPYLNRLCDGSLVKL